MLGRLLQAAHTLAAPPAARGTSQQNMSAKQPESNIEEAHTRDLLYPDIEALKTSQHSALTSINGRVPATPAEANSFDDRGGLDVSFPHHVRVIIAQDANARHPAQLLFDSKPKRTGTPQQENGPASSQRLHNRGKSFSSPPPGRSGPRQQAPPSTAEMTSPTSPLSPGRPRSFFGAGPSASELGGTDAEGSQGRVARESKEEVDGLLSCIFGAPGHRIEPGTKLHVLPKSTPEPEKYQTRMAPGGLAGGRRSNLTRSSSGFDTPRERGQSAPPASATERTSIMITRLFNVPLHETTVTDGEDEGLATPDLPSQASVKDLDGSSVKVQPHSHRVKQKKTPAYAIAIIIQLPTDTFTRTRSNPPMGVVSLPSSYQSSAPTSPRLPLHSHPVSWMEPRAQGALAADSVISSQISYILGNWSLISRNLRLLEITAVSRLKELLESIVPIVPLPVPSQGKAGNLKLRRPKLPSQQAVFVSGDCLQDDSSVRKQAKDCLQRITSGLRTRRVTPGQSRWGAWREEARSISRWAGTKDQNFFFFVFMSAFLGQHTQWLEQLAPKWYRRHAARQNQYGSDDQEALPCRTILICKNKMDARRLIFLASSFLPTNFKNSFPQLVVPLLGYGDSPPSLPTPRETLGQSGLRKSFSANGSTGPTAHGRSVSFSVAQPPDEPTDEERNAFGEELGRRASEAGSVRSAFGPLNTSRESRKASTSTFLADSQLSAQPVAHFSNVSIDALREAQLTDRPGSSASMASVALNQALKRSESMGATSVGSRLGNMVNGLWSGVGEFEALSADSAVVQGDLTPSNRRHGLVRGQSTSGIKPSLRAPNKLDQMVEEAGQVPHAYPENRAVGTPTPLGRSPGTQGPLDLESCLKKTPTGLSTDGKSAARTIPKRGEMERIPLQLNMNETDGFVDVSMPPGHSLNTSLASSFASLRLSSTGYPSAFSSMTGLWAGSGAGALVTSPPDAGEHFSPYGSPSFVGSASSRPEKTPEVAGWLKSFHPDFMLQAVQPYDKLYADIREALESEAKLSQSIEEEPEEEEAEEWRVLASILVADTSRFSVERFSLQRRKRTTHSTDSVRPSVDAGAAGTRENDFASTQALYSATSSSDSLSSMPTEERLIREPIMDVDPMLIDAFERVLAQVPNAELRAHSRVQSRAASRVPSRASSPIRSRPVSVRSSHPGQHPQSTSAIKQKQGHSQGRSVEHKLQDSGKFAVAQSAGKENAYKQIPFAECRSVILTALEEIAKSVIEDRDLKERNMGSSKDAKKVASSGAVLNAHPTDGTLREGVNRWLSKVEEGARRW